MNLEQMKARLQEIIARLAEYNALESFTDEDLKAIDELNAEFEGLRKNVEAKEKLEQMNAAAAASKPRVVSAPVARVEVSAPRNAGNAGFESAGEFWMSVKNAGLGRPVDKRLTIQNNAMEKNAEDGAFLIPTDFRTTILEKVTGDESLLGRTFQLNSTSNNISIPVDEVAPWSTEGIQAYWEGEAQTYQGSKLKFGQANMRLHKLTALVPVTEELLDDASALQSYIGRKAPIAMTHKVNSALISGDGVGKPYGIMNSGFLVTVPKESGQTADTVWFENIVKMYSRMLPASIGRSLWLINPALQEQLRFMKFDAAAASPVPAYMPPTGLAEAPYGTLMGRPIMPMMGSMAAIGDLGDILFVDYDNYISVVKTSGIKSDISTHVWFDKDLVAFKFSMRLAGECPYKAPVTTEFGSYNMSSFIALEAR